MFLCINDCCIWLIILLTDPPLKSESSRLADLRELLIGSNAVLFFFFFCNNNLRLWD